MPRPPKPAPPVLPKKTKKIGSLGPHWSLALLGALTILVPIVFYFGNFHGKLSGNPADWGSLGGYLSGWMAIAQLLVTFYITLLVQRFEDTRQQELDHRQAMDAVNAARNDAYKRLCDQLSRLARSSMEPTISAIDDRLNQLLFFNIQFDHVLIRTIDSEQMVALVESMKALKDRKEEIGDPTLWLNAKYKGELKALIDTVIYCCGDVIDVAQQELKSIPEDL